MHRQTGAPAGVAHHHGTPVSGAKQPFPLLLGAKHTYRWHLRLSLDSWSPVSTHDLRWTWLSETGGALWPNSIKTWFCGRTRRQTRTRSFRDIPIKHRKIKAQTKRQVTVPGVIYQHNITNSIIWKINEPSCWQHTTRLQSVLWKYCMKRG